MNEKFWNEDRIENLISEYWALLKAKEYAPGYTAICLFILIDLLATTEEV